MGNQLSKRADQILNDVLGAMAAAEELDGPDTTAAYIVLMSAIADAANTRIRGVLSHCAGEVNSPRYLLRERDGFAPELRVRFISRIPNPGVCKVRTIDWERGCASISNGACTYSADLKDLEVVFEAVPS